MTAPKSPSRKLGSISDKRLVLYGVAAGAALSAGASQADAVLVTLDLTTLPTASRTTALGGDLYFDVNAASAGAAVSTASFTGADFYIQNFVAGPNSIFGLNGNGIAGGQYEVFKASNLSQSNYVGPANTFSSAAKINGPYASFSTPGGGFLGLQFSIGSDLHYGWAEINVNSDGTATLDALGYETDANTPAHVQGVASVPDRGSSLALMAIGAVGLLAFRGSQRKAA